MVEAIVLCGGGPEPGLDPGLPNKGFMPIAGRPLVAHVVSALQRTTGVSRVAAAGPAEPLRHALPPDVLVVPDVGTIMDNIDSAVATLGATGRTLVVASDVPLLTPAVVEEFLSTCAKDSADFFYAIVPQDAMDAKFPGAKKTYVTLTEGTFTGGSVMLVNPQVVNRVRPFVTRLIADRKKPWRLAQLFGWPIVMKFAAGRLSIPEIVAKATELTGIAVTPVIIPRPELALDVDIGKPENLEIIRQALEDRSPD